MSKRNINFNLYRFHLIPITTNQTSILDNEKISYDDLVILKNQIFDGLVQNLTENNTDFPIIKFDSSDNKYLFGIANIKETELIKGFRTIKEKTEPFVYVLIDTDSNNQIIAISQNKEAFSSTIVTKNILKQIFNKHLFNSGLSIDIEQIFEVASFWDYIKKYDGRIKSLDFEIIKPNLSRISKSIQNSLKPLIEKVNSHKTNLKLDAPIEGVLENINEKNGILNGLVDYSSEGGGNISIKIQGINRKITTKNMVKTTKINEIYLSGHQDQVIKIWKQILDE